MSKKENVEKFLKDFKAKMDFWGIVFRDDRGKNSQTLLDLEITPNKRKEVLKKLEIKDYSEGPLEDKLNKGPDMWVFGKTIKNREIYIKITMGMLNNNVICISFHVAEFNINYPLKNPEL
ncbi:MAG: toxin [Chlorobi bacterium]|nr:toxin [Chlorobiota bacterium]